jgi:hypothetical protein
VQFSIQEQLLRRNVKRFRGGLVCKAHRLVYLSTLGLRGIKKKVDVAYFRVRTWEPRVMAMSRSATAASYLPRAFLSARYPCMALNRGRFDPRPGAVSYERGTPVALSRSIRA